MVIFLNAVLGLALFEWTWGQTEKHRTVVEERDKLFPAWRRLDAPKWNKYMMYPLAMTVLLPRALSFVGFTLLHVILHKILLVGTDVNKPIPPF